MYVLKILFLIFLPFAVFILTRRSLPSYVASITGVVLGIVIFPISRILAHVYGYYHLYNIFSLPVRLAVPITGGYNPAHEMITNSIAWGVLFGLCGYLLDKYTGRSLKKRPSGFAEIIPKTGDAYYLVLGAYHGAGKLSEKIKGLLNEEVLTELKGKILQYGKAVGIEDKLQGDSGKIDKVIAENCPERARQLFETGQILIALAFPGNLPSEKQMDTLEVLMKNLGIPKVSAILNPARKASQKETANQNEMISAVWNALAATTEMLNKKSASADTSSQPQKEITMGDLMETSLGKYSHLKPAEEYSKPEPNSLFLGYFSSPFMTVANTASGDPAFITELLSMAAEKMVPYAKKLDISTDIIIHGYNSIFSELSKKYSPVAASAYRMGFLLGGASAPSARFRTKKEYDDLLAEMKQMDIPHLKETDALDSALKTGKNELIVQKGTEVLVAVANVLEGEK